MSTTIKRITLALNKGEVAQLENLMAVFGENVSDIFKRALILLHYLETTKSK